MKANDSTKLDQIIATLGEVVDVFGERFDKIDRDMATKADLTKLDTSLHRELETIKEQLKNVAGFGKEIDHALERIAAIEKHLGIEKKIAA
jgi:hypothetical protein